MRNLCVTVIEKTEDISLFGLWINSNNKSVSKDISTVSKKYYEITAKKEGEVLPFYVLSRDYCEETKEFQLFVGGLLENSKLEKITIPKGLYGTMVVKPKFGFLWGLSIGEAKRFFYTKWLQKSEYVALNMEYEYHTQKSVSKKPEIEIYFAIDKKNKK